MCVLLNSHPTTHSSNVWWNKLVKRCYHSGLLDIQDALMCSKGSEKSCTKESSKSSLSEVNFLILTSAKVNILGNPSSHLYYYFCILTTLWPGEVSRACPFGQVPLILTFQSLELFSGSYCSIPPRAITALQSAPSSTVTQLHFRCFLIISPLSQYDQHPL